MLQVDAHFLCEVANLLMLRGTPQLSIEIQALKPSQYWSSDNITRIASLAVIANGESDRSASESGNHENSVWWVITVQFRYSDAW